MINPFKAKIVIDNADFECRVYYGYYTSCEHVTTLPHIVDERVPKGYYVFCSLEGRVNVLTALPPQVKYQKKKLTTTDIKVFGPKTHYKQLPKHRELIDKVSLHATKQEGEALWNPSWIDLVCDDQSQAEYIESQLILAGRDESKIAEVLTELQTIATIRSN